MMFRSFAVITPESVILPAFATIVRSPVPRFMVPTSNPLDSVSNAFPFAVTNDTAPPKLLATSVRVIVFATVTAKAAVPKLEIPPDFCVIGPAVLKLIFRREAKPCRVGTSKAVTPL